MNPETKLLSQALVLRRDIIRLSYKAQVGHVGSALSIVDIVSLIYFHCLRLKRDHFILSKGHAALAVYTALRRKNIITRSQLQSYCINGSSIEEHPNHTVPGIKVTTGSLGHGLSIGVGLALSAKLQKTNAQVFVIISDAECDEGQIWEAALSAAHHRLDNLFVFLDYNKVQAFGETNKVLNLEPLANKWKAFNWNVLETDGHSMKELLEAWNTPRSSAPTLFLCHTIRGKGVSYMHHHLEWHYNNISTQQYKQAMKELRHA